MEMDTAAACAEGLSRAQAQLAELIPLEAQRTLLNRALTMQPSLAGLRQLAALEVRASHVCAAAELLRQIPRYLWTEAGPSTDWHDQMRISLASLGCDLPEPSPPSNRLVIAFAFPPFATASGNVMARRIEADGGKVDVISNDMSGRERIDRTFYGAISPLIGQHLVLNSENWPARSAAFSDFADKAQAAVASGLFGRTHYPEVHSRAMWAQSHFAAAAVLAAGRADRWVAEFSDPCRLDLHGQHATAPADDAWLERIGIADLLRQRGHAVPQGRSLMYWAEYLPFCLADRIIFTNEVQRDVMLSQAEDSVELRARASGVAEVIAHPEPGARILSALPMPKPVRGPIWIGYFGNCNPRRGLSTLLNALSALPEDLRGAVQLHLHGPEPEGLRALIRQLDIVQMVRLHPPLDYLEALARMRTMDWLFVNDTSSTGAFGVTPFLPSKLADYRSAARPILALAEPGGPLSQASLPPGSLRVNMGDEDALRDVMGQIAASGRESLQS